MKPVGPLDLIATLDRHRHGHWDPTTIVARGRFVRATRTPDGAATIELMQEGEQIEARAFGPGAEYALAQVDDLLGMDEDVRTFEPKHDLMRDAHRKALGMRQGKTGTVFEALLPTIIEQRVTAAAAVSSYSKLVRRYGERAPGPFGLWLQPKPVTLARLPYYAFHQFGIEQARADIIRRAASRATSLHRATTLPFAEAQALMQKIPGIGPWTAAGVARDALGDPDTVSVGDFHLKNVVAYTLAGEPRATDERMLELLEVYAGHRTRAVRLIARYGKTAPKFGPRVKNPAIEHM